MQPAQADPVSSQSAFAWHDVRFIGAVAGRYVMSERREVKTGHPAVYACRLCSISTRLAVLVGPMVGKRGEMVTAHFEEFGIIRGKIVRLLESGFVIGVEASDEERDKLGAKIVWQKRRVLEQLPDKREHKRIIPRDPRSKLVLGDGQTMSCFIIDVSQSGAAISADIWPEIGTPMAVGRVVGRVVRYLNVGFAVQFIQLQDFAALETLIAPPADES